MKLVTERDRILGVLERFVKVWGGQAHRKPGLRLWNGRAYDEMKSALSALDLDAATKEEVDRIMGNTTWTDMRCSECSQPVTRAVCLDVTAGEYTTLVCVDCLLAAITLFAG